MIKNVSDLCDAIKQFHEMLEWDKKFETHLGNQQLVNVFTNLLEEFEDIKAYAYQYSQSTEGQ